MPAWFKAKSNSGVAIELRGEDGGALVEMAVILPLLMMLVMAAAALTLGFYNLQELTRATESAAQVIAAQQGVATDPCATAQTFVQAALPGWTASSLSYSLTVTDSGGTAHPYPSSGMTSGSGSFSCLAGAGKETANEPITLKVQYTYNWIPIPLPMPGIIPPVFSSPLNASETEMAD